MKELSVFYYASGADDNFNKVQEDFEEIMKVGTNSSANFVGLYGFGGSHQAKRGLLEKDGAFEALESLAEVSIGESKSFVEQANWAFDNYPSNKLGLVLVGHGTGWQPEDMGSRSTLALNLGDIPSINTLGKTLLFSNTAMRLTEEMPLPAGTLAIGEMPVTGGTLLTKEMRLTEGTPNVRAALVGDFSGKSLDAIELGTCLEEITRRRGKSIDFLGFDLCLMSTIEIISELSEYTHYIIASEQTEPASGWPHNVVAAALSDSEIPLNEHLKKIPHFFHKSYERVPFIDGTTLATLKMVGITKFLVEFKKLVDYLLADSSRHNMLKAAYWSVEKFQCNLVDLCGLLKALYSSGDNTLKEMCDTLLAILLAPDSDDRIIQEFAVADELAGKAYGVSIYFPTSKMSSFYEQTLFSKKTGWGDLMKAAILR